MHYDYVMFSTVSGLFIGLMLTLVLTKWRAAKGKTSIFAQDHSLEEVGFSAISGAFESRGHKRIDGITEIRPTWGIRLFAPAIALILLLTMDIGAVYESLMASIGINNPSLLAWILIAVTAAFAYSWFMLMFVQRVLYDDVHIQSFGTNMGSETRSLTDVVDIRVHEKRPALVLTFAGQKPLYVPKFLSQREAFLADIETTIQRNRARGLTATAPTLAAKLGF